MKHSNDELYLPSEMIAKIIGVLCVAVIFVTILFGDIIGVIVSAIIVIPLAIYCRKLMNKDEKKVKNYLDKYHASCGIKGKCYEGSEYLKEGNDCLILFKGKEIAIIDQISSNRVNYAKEEIKEVKLLTLNEVKEISSDVNYYTLGELGKYYYSHLELQKPNRKDKQIKYLIIRIIADKKIKCICFYIPNEFTNLNRNLANSHKLETYFKENY